MTGDGPPAVGDGNTMTITDGTEHNRTAEGTADGASGGRAGSGRPGGPPYLLRDLDRRGRLWAGAFAAAILLAPVLGFLDVAPDWVPANDPALIGLQSLEVGTADTPLTGQPSTSANYVDAARHVDHLGPLHDYLLVVPMRVLGPATGMLSISLVIACGCLLLAAWATYRRLGPAGGAIGCAAIGLVTFTTGASSLLTPVSSTMAGYPLLCSAVLLWCVLQGDLRVLPAATAVTAFTAQLHLSVLPTVAILVPAALAGLLYTWGRDGRWRERAARVELARWGGASAAIGLLLWSPILLQQATGNPGNLTNLASLTVDNQRPTLGPVSGIGQVAHVLGLPPILGRLDLSGGHLTEDVSPLTAVSAAIVVVLLATAGTFWHRHGQPEKRSLAVMAGLLAVAGLVNGSSVLDSLEQLRLVLYHWIIPLSFFTVLALALGAATALRWLAARAGPGWRDRWMSWTRQRPFRPALATVALLTIAVPAVVNPSLDRTSNELVEFRSPTPRRHIEALVDGILEQQDLVDEPVLLIDRGARGYSSALESLALYLVDAGVDIRLPESFRYYVADDLVAGPESIAGGLLVVHDATPDWAEVTEGDLLTEVRTVGTGIGLLRDLAGTVRDAGTVRFGPEVRATFDDFPEVWVDAAERGELAAEHGADFPHMNVDRYRRLGVLLALDQLRERPAEALSDPHLLDLLMERPLAEPELDPEALRRLRASELGSRPAEMPLRIRVYRLDRDELAEAGFPS